jgi:acyl-CoA hydrolase
VLELNRLVRDFTVGLSAVNGQEGTEPDRRSRVESVAVDRRVGERRRRGRPARVDGVVATRRREFRLTADEDRELARVARENGQHVATLIREAVNEYVADYAERRQPLRT